MKLTSGLLSLIFVGLVACGKEELPQKPQLILDRETVTFGQEFGNATYIGTRPQESIVIENGGLEPLTLNTSYSGDPAFTIEGPLKSELKGKETTFIRVLFAPTEDTGYGGSLTLTSNAENASQKVIAISGRGVTPPGDASAALPASAGGRPAPRRWEMMACPRR